MKTLLSDVDLLTDIIGGQLHIHMNDECIALRKGDELEKAVDGIHKLYEMLQGELVDDRYVVEETA